MNIVKRIVLIFVIFTLTVTGLVAAGPKTVATTEWAAAFCRAAGLEEIQVLAPASLTHPPDYELKPSDIPILMNADLIVFGGYEAMMDRIRSHIAGSDTQMLKINTTYAPAVLRESVRLIAETAGTDPEPGLAEIDQAWNEAREAVAAAGLSGEAVLSHRFQEPFSKQVGLDVRVVFGPAPPGPKLIPEAAGSGATLVVDNLHNPVSAPLAEVLGNPGTVDLINFPGRDGTRNLADVIRYNAGVLVEFAEGR